ncbi:hypothetical protein NliqN6_3324 [Naganishia liquefaciens]|uniref:rRNA methyltransferase 2, mitochondrial n=1 Tax=Naganishia liquefaciens TaxID=104408 RepID=A0A8H3YG65_9TREE|nr:hypothetical protein NliqN6_3324 [Naganishia liquefaciens]
MPRLTTSLLKQSSSSGRWLTRQRDDPFVRARAVAEGNTETLYRSRSSFKLNSLAKKYPCLLPRGGLVLDLGAAPGGWSQVAAPKVGSRGRVVALDLLPILPISKNVTILQGDFLSPSIQEELAAVIAGSTTLRSEQPISQRDAHFSEDTRTSLEPSLQRVDSILSDMMANMSGIRARDIEASLELCETALRFARGRLKTGLTKSHAEDGEGKKVLALRDYKGNMLMKFFQHPLLADFKKTQLEPVFEKVAVEKPKESRSESSEAYFVCLGYRGD